MRASIPREGIALIDATTGNHIWAERYDRDLPRKIDIDKRADHDLQDILLMHDPTPRKCLGFKTPARALSQPLGLDIKISFHRGVALHS